MDGPGQRGNDDGGRLPGEVTGRISLGGYVLDVGAAAGTRLTLAPGDTTSAAELAEALEQDEEELERRRPGEAIEEIVDDASGVTDKVERSLELFTSLAEGRFLDRGVLQKEIDALLAALGRLDRAGRYEDVLRLARSLSKLLTVALRWAALIEALRRALRAADALAATGQGAWARHELGTLHLVAGDADQAVSNLREAKQAREQLGEERELALTEHNLQLAEERLGSRVGRLSRRTIVLAAALAVVLAIGGAGVAVALTRGPSAPTTEPPTSTQKTASEPTTTTESEPTTDLDTTTTQATTTSPPTTDTSSPVLNLPEDITTEATSRSGAVVPYEVTATDVDDPPDTLTVTCLPPSGSTFTVGTTPVKCTAADPAGNTSTGSFDVTVTPIGQPTTVVTVIPLPTLSISTTTPPIP
jgi:cytoskeletal protein RodZ